MKAACINGSPRKNRSVSLKLLQALKERLPGCEVVHGWDKSCDVLIIAFPLYVDGIPSNLLRELVAHEQDMPMGGRVYAVANNGFYEGEQNATAIAMLRHWSERAGLAWGMGVGVGAGSMLESGPVPVGRGPLKSLGRALDALAAHILAGESGEDIYTRPDMPRLLYRLGGELSFRAQAKKHGLSRGDIERRL